MSQGSTASILFNGVPAVHLRVPDGSEATVLLHGAHVVSWKPGGGEDRLYLSEMAQYDGDNAVRGGIPVIFPQFAKRGAMSLGHGFARRVNWELVDAHAMDDYAIAVLRLIDSEETRAMWPHAFKAELTVGVAAGRIDVELEVENTGTTDLSFTAALHTYLRVKEVEEAELEGLRGRRYYDNVKGEEKVDSGVALMVDDELDRIYFATGKRTLVLHERHRKLSIQHENMPETVVWNPWEKRTAEFTDMPANGFRRMLCVEAAVIDTPVQLAPQASWWGRQTLMVVK
jgi:glucose-6-phosphate 1-epimerase